MSRGWTLHEMLISLAVTGGIFVMASGAALGHLRWARGTGEIATLRAQLGHATAIAANVLEQVAAPSDVLVAGDTVAEVIATYGVALSCRADTGRVTIPAPTDADPRSAFGDTPQPGDEVRVLVADDSSVSWMAARAAASPQSGNDCPALAGVARTWSVVLVEPFTVGAGAAVHFARRTRLSSYRAGDGRWYLGMREWNGAAGAFNGIQPIAGPLRPAMADSATTGFLLVWSDSAGARLSVPAEPGRITSVTITTRGETPRPARVAGLWSRAAPRYADSLSAVVTIRNRS